MNDYQSNRLIYINSTIDLHSYEYIKFEKCFVVNRIVFLKKYLLIFSSLSKRDIGACEDCI